jgi:hypothetical protein
VSDVRKLVALLPDGLMAYTVDGEPLLSRVHVDCRDPDVPTGTDEYHRSLGRLCVMHLRGELP